MKRIYLLGLAWLAALAPFATIPSRGAAPTDLQRVLPFADEFTVVVARFDLGAVDPATWAAGVLELLPGQRPTMAEPVDQARQAAQAWLDEFRRAGGKVLYLLFSLNDLGLEPPVAAVIPLADGSDAARLEGLLKQLSLFPDLSSAALHDCVVVARDSVLDRVKGLAAHPPRFLESAYAAAPPGVVQVALLPYEDAARVVEELMPVLPASLGGGSSSSLARGLRWASVSVQPPPNWVVELAAHTQTAADAEAIADLITRGLAALGNVDEVKQRLPRWTEIQTALKPVVAGDTVRVRLDASQIGELARTVALPALEESKQQAGRIMLLNNLKQIGLALVMFADDHGGRLPDHFADTLTYLGSASVFLPGGSSVTPPADLQRQDRAAQVAWLDRNSGLVYLRPGVLLRSIKQPDQTPLVHQKPELNREPFVGVCFADGHAEYMTREAFDRLLERSKNPSP